jgi:putative membrane protein
MPFAYSIDAARQCVAGIYGNAYVYDLLALCVYIGVALFIGLVVSIPCKRLNRIIDESKERTDLMA